MDQDKVLEILQDFFKEKVGIEDLTVETDLKEYKEFDSLLVVELILFLEESLDIEVAEEDYAMENYESVQGILNVVKKSLETKETGNSDSEPEVVAEPETVNESEASAELEDSDETKPEE